MGFWNTKSKNEIPKLMKKLINLTVESSVIPTAYAALYYPAELHPATFNALLHVF